MANEGLENDNTETASYMIRCALSKVVFPEICPVCLGDPEDLVAITVIERPLGEKGDDRTYSALKRGTSKTDIALEAARGATTLWIPTCLRHGSRNVRSDKMRLMPALAFFILFYPILYFFLAVRSSNSLVNTVGLVASVVLLLSIFLYSYVPRALERHLKVIELERSKDLVYLNFKNPDYFQQFINLNEMHCDILDSIDADI